MTIWTVKAWTAAGETVALPDFDDGGDPGSRWDHLATLSSDYVGVEARPQTPVTEGS